MTNKNIYETGTYFAMLFDTDGTKHGILYGSNINILRDSIHDIQQDTDVDYVILQVVENPKNKELH